MEPGRGKTGIEQAMLVTARSGCSILSAMESASARSTSWYSPVLATSTSGASPRSRPAAPFAVVRDHGGRLARDARLLPRRPSVAVAPRQGYPHNPYSHRMAGPARTPLAPCSGSSNQALTTCQQPISDVTGPINRAQLGSDVGPARSPRFASRPGSAALFRRSSDRGRSPCCPVADAVLGGWASGFVCACPDQRSPAEWRAEATCCSTWNIH
jgi:hypothetical protein